MRRAVLGSAAGLALALGEAFTITPALAGGSPRFLEPAPTPATTGYKPTKYRDTKRAYRTEAVRKKRKAQRAARKAERRGRK